MPLQIECLSRHLFWDTDVSQLSVEEHWRFIIVRVVERGTCEDVRAILNGYGRARVREALLQARNLNERTISFFANLFALPKSQFRAYSKQV